MARDRHNKHWRLHIGEISPTVWDYGEQLHEVLPDGVGVSVVTAGSPVKKYERENLTDARDNRLDAVEILDYFEVDCIIAGGGPPSTVEGVESETAFAEEIRELTDIPFATAIEAQIDAFEELDAESILMVTPFDDERDQETREYVEHYGIEVPHTAGPPLSGPRDVRRIDTASAYHHAVEAADRYGSDVDAIYIACAPYTPVRYLESIETDTGLPLVTSLQAHVWKAFDLVGRRPTIPGYGSLLDRPA